MGVYYLEFRPQTIGQLDNSGGREVLRALFKKKAEGDDIPKSYLFCGPKGAGKTSAARIFAKALNCLKQTEDACGECENCVEIGRGKSMDVVELDAASNRGIDEVRLLKERVILAPTKLKSKVVIIDEAQMMTKEAFNALLKLLEEPPENTYFIMCTTEVQKIPETIISRLVKVEFNKGKTQDLEESLKRVVDKEGLELDKEAVEGLIGRSEGSFRNLHRLLNELVVAKGKKITKKDWGEYEAGMFGGYGAQELLTDLELGKTENILSNIEQMAQNGVDFSAYLENLIGVSQQKMILAKDRSGWVGWLEGLIEASGQMKYCPVSQVPIELAVVKYSQNPGSPPGKPAEIQVENKSQNKKAIGTKKDQADAGGKPQLKPASEISLEGVETNWAQVLAKVKPYNHSIEAFLRATKPVAIEGDELVVEVFYPFHKERLEEARNRRVIEEVLKLVLGCELRLICQLRKPGSKTVVVETNEVKTEPAAAADSGEASKDLYQAAKEIFG